MIKYPIIITLILILIIFLIFNNNLLNKSISKRFQFHFTENFDNKVTLESNKLYINNKNNNIKIKENSITIKKIKSLPQIIDVLKLNNIPSPNYVIIDKLNYLRINPYNYPLILRPLQRHTPNDVFVDITNIRQFEMIRDILLDKFEKIIMADFINGKNYRININGDNITDIYQLVPPHVIGDDRHTILELIQNYNKNKNNNKVSIINYDTIQRQGFSVESVLPVGIKIYITNFISIFNGSKKIPIDINQIPKENLDIFIQSNNLLENNNSIIHYISPDIYNSYKKNNGSIVDIDSDSYQDF